MSFREPRAVVEFRKKYGAVVSMIEKWSIAVRPVTGREARTVYVYIPDAAADDPDARYPVLYMFDGHNVFFDEDATYGKSWGMREYLDATDTRVIVVAVDCNHRLPNGRLSEYSPFDFSDPHFGSVEGKGGLFMRWMVRTLKPRIDRTYPTLRDRAHTWIAGSSMGGLMSLYAVTAHNDVFGRAAALSPSVWLVRDRMIPLIRNSDYAPDTVIYLDYGQREMGSHRGMKRAFMQTAKALYERGALITCRLVPNGDHCEACWEEQLPVFMPILTYFRE